MFYDKIKTMDVDPLISSMIETISVTFAEFDKLPQEGQVRLIFQSLPFFTEIFSSLKGTVPPRLVETADTFLRSCNRCMNGMMKEASDISPFAGFLTDFCNSLLVESCADSLGQLFVGLANLREAPPDVLAHFHESFRLFFGKESLRTSFIMKDGFLSAWWTYVAEPENSLVDLIFIQIGQNMKHFGQPMFSEQIGDFLSAVSTIFAKLSLEQGRVVISLVQRIVSERPEVLIKKFEESHGFHSLAEFIIIHQDEDVDVISFLEYFTRILPFEKDRSNIALNMIIDILGAKECKLPLKRRGLAGISGIVGMMNAENCPLPPNEVSLLANSVDVDDAKSVELLSQILCSLNANVGIDLAPIIPFLHKFFTAKLLFEADMSKLIALFLKCSNDVKQFIQAIFANLMEGVTVNVFADMLNRYNDLYEFFVQHFAEPIEMDDLCELMKMFILGYPLFSNREAAEHAIEEIIRKKGGYLFTSDIFQCLIRVVESNDVSLLIAITKIAEKFSSFRLECVRQKVYASVISLKKLYRVDVDAILDFVAVLAKHRFLPSYDENLYAILASEEFLGATPEQLLLLALGLRQGSDPKRGSLCFPSLLGQCAEYQFTSRYDLWICGKIGIDAWQRDTKRPISEFPSIVSVATQYIEVRHVKELINYPHIFYKVCTQLGALPPLFEFLPYYNSSFSLTFETTKSFSFWFNLQTAGPESTYFVTLGATPFVFCGNEIRCENSVVATIETCVWILFYAVIDNSGQWQIYLNKNLVYTMKPLTPVKSVTFGGKLVQPVQAHWFVGGTIRLFSTPLPETRLATLLERGVGYKAQLFSDIEIGRISPATYVPQNGFPSLVSANIKKMRPIIIYSLGDYIRNVMNGCQFIYNTALEKGLGGEIEAARLLVMSLCTLKQKGVCNWPNNELALAMSALYHIAPDVFDVESSEWILAPFIDRSTETLDWRAYLSLCLDYTRFIDANPAKVVSDLFALLAQYPIPADDIGSQMCLAWFLLSLLAIDDFNHEYDPSILDMILKLKLDPQVFIYWLASIPDLCSDLSSTKNEYQMKASPVVTAMVTNFAMLNPTRFYDYYLLFVLPADDAINMIAALLDSTISNLDYHAILDCLALNCHVRKAWDCALSIMTNARVVISDTPSIDLSNFDMSYLLPFLRMLSTLIAVAVRLPEDKFWFMLAKDLCHQLIVMVTTIPEKCITGGIRFWMLQLMTFGNPLVDMSPFPLMPGAESADQVVDVSFSRGQEWPETTSMPFSFPTREPLDHDKNIAEVGRNLERLSPKEMFLSSTVKIPVRAMRYIQMIPDLYHSNVEELAADWNEFISNKLGAFGVSGEPVPIETILEKGTKLGAFSMLANMAMRFHTLENAIMNGHAAMPAKLVVAEQRVIQNIIVQELDTYQTYSANMIELVCNRIIQGWHHQDILFLFEKILSIVSRCNDNFPPSFIQLLILGFDIVDTEDIRKWFDLIANSKIITNPKFFCNIEIFLTLIGKVFMITTEFTDSFYQLWNELINALMGSDQFISTWKKEYPKLDVNVLFEAMLTIYEEKSEGFLAWKSQRGEAYEPLEQALGEFVEKNRLALKNNVKSFIAYLMNYRVQMTREFCSTANSTLRENMKVIAVSKSTAASIRMLFRSAFLLIEEFFVRQREFYISKVYKVPLSGTDRKAVTILSDPIYPARRLEYSPLQYQMPSFPDGVDGDMFPERGLPIIASGVYPKCCTDLFSFCPVRVRLLLQCSPYLMHMKYAAALPIRAWQRHSMLEILLNGGKAFKFEASCTFLYGIDPLEGIVLLTDQYLFFVEGVKLVQSGVEFYHSHEMAPEHFYQCYMLSGHFGTCFQFHSHMVVGWDLGELLSVTNHMWIHKPYSIALNFVRGFNFILNFDKQNFEQLFPILKKVAQDFMDTAPPATAVPSPITSARYLTLRAKEVASKWTNGEIDTFTYLCIVNRLGKRLTSDLTQYPVFPWIVADYKRESLRDIPDEALRNLALPMGQIGEERAKRFDEIFRDSESSYYYGTHYMHFYVVLYFMFRLDPFCFMSILLHKGWDHPSRLFWSLEDSWKAAAYESTSDVKEVIPQFFCVPEIFENISNIPATITIDGTTMTKVQLPAWCKNSRDFTTKMMRLLNGKRISQNIPKWVDLIFGCKSRGHGAVESKNLFPKLCYSPAKADKPDQEDDVEREANIVSIINFGQVPQQVTKKPCPTPKTFRKFKTFTTSPDTVTIQRLWNENFFYPVYVSICDGQFIFTSNFQISIALPSSHMILVSESSLFILKKPSNEFVRVLDHIDFSNVSSIAASADGYWLCLTRRDGAVLLCRIVYQKGDIKDVVLMRMFSSEPNLISCSISASHFVAFAGGNKAIYPFDIGLYMNLPPIFVDFTVTLLEFDEFASLLYVAGEKHVAVCSVSGDVLVMEATASTVTALAYSKLPGYTRCRFIVTGHEDGCVVFWQIDCGVSCLRVHSKWKISDEPVCSLFVSQAGQRVIVGTRSDVYVVEAVYGSTYTPVKRELYAVECAICKCDVRKNALICSRCGRFVCAKCAKKETTTLKTTITCNHCLPVEPSAQ